MVEKVRKTTITNHKRSYFPRGAGVKRIISMSLIYLIQNLINNKQYVGQTTRSVSRRWSDHKARAKAGSLLPIHCAIRKYGTTNFSIVPIWIADSLQELNEMEKRFICALGTQCPTGYNRTDGGVGSIGYKHTPEALNKMSRVHLGNTYRRGSAQSLDARRAMSIHHTGLKQSAETIAKRIAKCRGQKRSEESRRRMSDAAKIHNIARNFPQDKGAALRGKPWSAARRAAQEKRG
jgi:group I intron endonuclease